MLVRKNTLGKQALRPQFLQKIELFLEYVFIFLPGAAERSGFTSDYPLLLAGVLNCPLFATCDSSLQLCTA